MDKRLTFSQVILTYTLCGLVTLQPAMANVVIDASVVNTSKITAGNGVEVVNIATPDSNGLSHNKYQQFNVDSKGLILNNSTAQLAQSQLGGLLQNNPNLNGKSASVILNEVTGANRSKLEGYTEVFGQSANVILANPYGITCDGCGFINTPRVTFSTGTPEFEKGALSGFNVAEGSVSIEGLGLDASNQTYFDIISRTAEINSAIHANDLSIITGSNQVEYRTNKAIKQANSSSDKPQLAIDSSSIGGMYAGRIALIATEDGVGVNVGELSTSQGNITISANGGVRLGRTDSAKSLEIGSQGNVVIEGEQRIKTELSIEGAEVTIQDAKVAAGQSVNLDSDSLTLSGSQIDTIELAAKVSRSRLDSNSSLNAQSAQLSNVSSLDNQGAISVAETLDVSGKALSVAGSGTIQTKQLSVSADTLTFGSTARTEQAVLRANEHLKSTEDTDLSAVDNLTLSSSHIDTSGSLKSGSSLLFSGENVVHRGQAQGKTVVIDAAASSIKGVLESVGDLTVHGDRLDITGTVQSTGEVVLTGRTQVSSGRDSQLLAGQRLSVTGPQVALTGKTSTGAELVVEGDSVTLGGTVTSQDAVTVRGQSLSQSGVLASVGDMTLSQRDSVLLTGDVESGGVLSVETGVLSSTQKLLSGKTMSLTANTTTLQGEVSSGEQLILKSDSLTQSGQMVAKQALSLLAGEAQLDGRVQSDDTLSVTIQGDLNVGNQGQLVSQLPLTVTSQTLVNQGQLSSGGDIGVSAEHLTHQGTISSAGKVSLNGRTLVQNGDIEANQGIQLITESDLVSDGDVISGGEISVTAKSLDNRGEFSTSDALVVRVTEDVVNRASGILAGEQLTLSSRRITNAGTLQALDTLNLTADSLLNTGRVIALGQALINANQSINNSGVVSVDHTHALSSGTGAGSVLLRTASLTQSGTVVSSGDAQLLSDSQTLSGTTVSGGDLTVQGEHLDITGTVQSTGEVVLAGGTQVSSGQDSQLLAGQRLRVTGPQVSLTGKTGTGAELVIEGNSVTLGGTVTSQDAVTVRGQSLSQSGVLASVGDMTLSQRDSVSLTGDVESGGALSVETGVLSSTQKLLSGKAMSLTANTTTLQGEVSSGDQLTLKSDSLTQSGQMVAKQALSLLSNKAQLNGRVQSDDTLSVTIQDDLNVGSQGQLVSQLPLTITSQTLVNQGQFSSGGDIDVSAEHLTHEGTILSAGKVSLNGRTLVQNGDIEANQGIQLITESDLVSDGDVVSGGEISVTAKSLDNRGELSTSDALVVRVTEDVVNRGSGVLAGEQLTLSSRGITNAGTLQALDTLNLTAESLLNTGRVIALGQALINANQSINNSGVVSVDHTHALSSGTGAGSVLLRTASLTQSGTVVSSGDAQLLSDSQTLSGTTVSGGDLTVQGEHLDITGTVQSTGEVVLAGGTQVSSGQDSQLLAGQRLRVTGPQVSLTGKTGTGAELVIEGNSVTLGGTVTSQDAVTVRGQSLSQSGVLASVGDMTLSQRDSVSLTGDVESGGALSVETGVLSSTQKLLSGKSMSIAADSIQLSGVVSSLSTLIAQAKTLTQTGRTLSLGDMTLKADQIVVSGEIQSGQSMLIAADNSLTTQSQSSLKTGVDLAANSEQFHHQGNWLSGGDSKVIAKHVNNQGQLQSQQDFNVQAHQLTHQGTLASNRDLDITVNGEYHNQYALIAGRNLHLKAARLENSSEISSRNLTRVELDEGLTNQSGGVISGETTDIQAGDVANSGTLQAITALGLTSDSLHNSGALVSLSDLTLQSGGTLTNHGLLYAGGNANLFSENLNNYSDVLSGQDMVIARNATLNRNNRVINSSGTIESIEAGVSIYSDVLENKRSSFNLSGNTIDHRSSIPGGGGNTYTVGQSSPLAPKVKYEYRCPGGGWYEGCPRNNESRIAGVEGKTNSHLAYTKYLTLSGASGSSFIRAKDDIAIHSLNVINQASSIHAMNVNVSASKLENTGYELGTVKVYHDYNYKSYQKTYLSGYKFLYALDNVREIFSGSGRVNSSITATNRLNLNVSNTVNNSTIRANSAVSGSTAQSRQWQATQSAVVSGPDTMSLDRLGDVEKIQSADIETQSVSNTRLARVEQPDSATELSLKSHNGPEVTSIPTESAVLHRVSEVSAPLVAQAPMLNEHSRPDIRLISSGPVPFPEFRLPNQPNGLFVFSPKPEGRYVIETNPLLTNLDQFLGSDYFQNQVDYYPEEDVTFLGDAFYDTRVITQAIFEETGQRYLGKNVGSDLAQMQQLMDSAAAEKQALDLQVGIALSAQQVASLKQDIVWYETIEVNGKSVLAPKLYLAEVTKKHIVSGAQIAATHTDIQSGHLDNSGEIVGSDALTVVSQDGITNTGGTIRGGNVSLTAESDILNLSGDILGENLALTSSSGSVINETLVKELRAMHGGGESVFTDIGRTANIGSGHTLSINAGENIENVAASISAGGDASLAAVQDIVLDTKANTQAFDVDLGRKRVGEKTTEHIGSSIGSGGHLSIAAGRDVSVTASEISAIGDLNVHAIGDVTVQTAKNLQSDHLYRSGYSELNRSTNHQGSSLSGSDVVVTSGSDITLSGSQIVAEGSALLKAKQDINVLAVNDSQYHFDKAVRKKSFGRRKTTINETYHEQAKGSVIAAGEDITLTAQNLDSTLTPGGDSDIRLIGSELNAQEQVTLTADGDVTLAAQSYKTYQRHESIKKGFGGLSGHRKGSIDDATLLNSSYVINSGDVSVTSGQSIGVLASEVTSGGDVNLNAIDDVLVAADEVLKQSQRWDEKSSFLSGGHLFEMEKNRQGEQSSTAQASQISAGGNLNVDAGSIKVVGSSLTSGQDASLKADTGNVEVLSAKESISRFESEEKLSVGLGDFNQGISFDDGTLKVTLGEAKYDKVTTQSEETRHQGSVIASRGNVSLSAESDIRIEGSDLRADAESDRIGDLNLEAKDSIIVKEVVDQFDEQKEEIHGSAEVSLVVQHQAAEVAKAAEALKDSTKRLKKAQQDYKQYKKGLDSLSSTLARLEQEYSDNKPGVAFEDVEELRDLVSDVKSDEAWYVSGVALAAEDVTSKTTLLAQQSAAASQSAATYGFNAGLHLDIQASQTDSTTQQTTSIGSNLSGQNVVLNAGQKNGDQALVRGSIVEAKESLTVAANEVNITASLDTHSSQSETRSGKIGASMTVYGASTGVNLNTSFDRNQSTSSSKTHNNSQLSADNVSITSAQDTNIKGATVDAEESLTLDVGGDLNVASVQDRHSSTNKGQGISGGLSLTGGSDAGQLTGGSSGINASNGRTSSKQTIETRLTSNGSLDIDVVGNTDLKGATIAALDDEGKDSGQLNLTTDSFTYADLSNTRYNQNRSMGVSTSAGVNAGEIDSTHNSTSIQYKNTSGYSKSKTLATIGQGQLNIADSENSDDTTALNRDIEHTDKDLFSVDRQQGDIDVTVDHRLLSEEGRNDIAEDVERTERLGQAIADVATKDSIVLTDTLDHIDDVQKDLDVQKNLALSDGGKSVDILENKQNYSVEEYDQALNQYAQAYASVYGVTIESAKAVATEKFQGMTYSNSAEGNATDSRVSIDYNNNDGATGVAETMGHEAAHVRIDQGQTRFREGELAEEYADTFGEYSADGMEFSAGSYTNVQLNNPKADNGKLIGNTQLINNTTEMYQDINRAAQGDGVVNYRQLDTPEIQAIRKHAPQMAKELGISTEEAEKRMAEELVTRVDSDWQDYYKSKGRKADGEALNHLSEALSSLGANYVQPDLIPDPEATYTPDGVKADLVNYKDNYEHRYNDATLYGEGLVIGDKEQQDFYINNLGEHKPDLGETASGTAAGVAKPILDVVDVLEWGIKNPEEGIKLPSYGYQEILNNPGEAVEGIYEGYVDSQVNSVLSSLQGDNYNAAKSGTAGTVQLGLDIGVGTVLVKGTKGVSLPDGGRLPNSVDGVDRGDSFKQQTYSTSMTNEVTPSVNAGVDGIYVNNAETSQSGTSAGYNSNESARGPPESTANNATKNADGYEVPELATRNDKDFSSAVNDFGVGKSRIDESGNMIPTNPDAEVNVIRHIVNDPKYKNNAPTTSASEVGGANTPQSYGPDKIVIETGRLQRDINDGKISDAQVIPHQQIRDQLQNRLDTAQKRYDANPSKNNTDALERAKRNLENASRDNECLLVGCIPNEYIQGGQ
ncbi:hemagglutinin repeat-containing protein [Vibrio ostreicida]|uniref:two-partner secretion domain-containing protein n=1 Tax=Vibrio ostreicida TaxID=526588 RepID=UPI003B5CFB35